MIALTKDEAELARRAQAGNGEPYEMAGKGLNPAVLRALLMGLPVRFPGAGKDETVKIPATGVRAKGARISGTLDLADGRGPDGGPMPALVLEGCICHPPILLDRAHIRHLSLKHSKICHLHGCGVHVESTLDLTGLVSAEENVPFTGATTATEIDGTKIEESHGLCWVELQEAQIDGAVEANGAVFVAPPKRDNLDAYAKPARYALDLGHAHVRVCVRVREGGCAIGGISVAGGEIGGDVWADGATLTAVEGHAFSSQTAHIGGNVVLRAWSPPGRDTIVFAAEGEVRLLGAKIAGNLEMSGARATGDLIAANVEIGGDALLRARDGQTEGRPQTYPFSAEKEVNFLGAKIAGDLDFNGANFAGKTTIDNATVGGNLQLEAQYVQNGDVWTFQPLTTGAKISLANAKVTGAMYVDLEPKPPEGVLLRSVPSSQITTIDLHHTHVGALADRGGRGFGTHCRLKLDGFCYDCLQQDEPPELRLPVGISRVRRSINLLQKLVKSRQPPSSVGKPANRRTLGELCAIFRFGCAQYWNELCQLRSIQQLWDFLCYPLRLVATALQKYLNRFCRPVVQVPLLAAVAIVLAAVWGLGWPIVAVRVAGVVALLCYGLWWFKKSDFHCGRWEARIDWLNLQYESEPTPEVYTPEPYEQLTATLRTAGFYRAARKIASHRLTLERRLVTPPFLRFFTWLFGVCFDYGLSPQRAVFTFLACLAVGSIGVGMADTAQLPDQAGPVLVIEAHTVNTMADKDKHESGLLSAFEARTVNTIADNNKQGTNVLSTQEWRRGDPVTTKLPCGKEIDPLSYAADVFVPALDLHQDDKCVISPAPEARPWRWAYALYAALGWIVTALTILTVSGILRRHVEG